MGDSDRGPPIFARSRIRRDIGPAGFQGRSIEGAPAEACGRCLCASALVCDITLKIGDDT